jgi:YgiT-type zinc finger domain-containing protein
VGERFSMKCYFCGGTTKEKLVTDLYTEERLYVAVENVPADVCKQCGQRYYRPDVVDKLLAITESMREHSKVAVPGQRAEFSICDFAVA